MSNNIVCRSCLRALRQAHVESRLTVNPARTFSTTRARLAASSRTNEPASSSSPAHTSKPGPDASTMQKFAARMRAQKSMQAATEPYVAYGSTQELFKASAVAGDYTMPTLNSDEDKPRTAAGEDLGMPKPGTWFETYDILPTFNAWAQITFVHMYLLTVRLRMFPEGHSKHWHQNLLDHFFYAAEDRMATFHGMEARSVRNKYLKDLFVQWRGVLLSYDEGLIKGDAVLAAAVWRNVFAAREDVDMVKIAEITAWIKKTLKTLERMSDAEIAAGNLSFEHPKTLAGSVAQPSKGASVAQA